MTLHRSFTLVALATTTLSATAPVAADSTARSVSAGARVGVLAPQPFSELDSFVIGGLDIGVALPVMQRRLALGAGVLYSKPPASGSGDDSRLSGGGYDWKLDQQMVVVELTAMLRLRPPGARMTPFGRAGARLYLLGSQIDGMSTADAAFGEHRESSREVGAVIGGGVEAAVGPGHAIGQLDVGYSDMNTQLTGDANTGAIELSAGYRLAF